MAFVAKLAAWFVLVCSAISCTAVVTPPRSPERPTTVFVLREALHVGIVLPTGAGAAEPGFVEFGFGEWSWYALGNEAWYRVFPVVLWPTGGTLCRRTFAARDEAMLREQCAAAGRELDAFTVETRAAEALRTRLGEQFAAAVAQGASVQRPELGMEFVPSSESYWFANTCADAAARWCEDLGCTVGWWPIRGSLAVRRD